MQRWNLPIVLKDPCNTQPYKNESFAGSLIKQDKNYLQAFLVVFDR